MTLYPGTRIEQEYAHGRAEGRLYGEHDLENGLGLQTWMLGAIRNHADTSVTREGRAFHLGRLRGYREAVRTLRWGRWGT